MSVWQMVMSFFYLGGPPLWTRVKYIISMIYYFILIIIFYISTTGGWIRAFMSQDEL